MWWKKAAGKEWPRPPSAARGRRPGERLLGLVDPVCEFDRGAGGGVALSVSTDALVFNEDERGPDSPDLRLHLEALNQLDDDEKATVINLIKSILLRHQARRLARSS